MNSIKKFWGQIINGVAKFLSLIFEIIIHITEGIVLFVRAIGKGLFGLISMGGCLMLFLLGPFAFSLLFNPAIMTFIYFL